jgi:electron transfer flavoprotein alpha subunit
MAKKIWVVLQQREGKLHRMSREAIAAGQKLAGEIGGETAAILLGSGVSALAGELAGVALSAVYVADDSRLADYTPGAYVGVLKPAIAAGAPDYVVFPHTYQSVDFVARLAQELDAAYVPEVISFESIGGESANSEVADAEVVFKRPILTGKLHARVRVKAGGPVLLSVQSGAFPADGLQAGSAASEALAGGEPVADRELLGVEQVGGDQIDLSKADVVVAVGRGIGKQENMAVIQALAKALGADIGASRPVIDNGWLERDRQIGSSGQTVAPKLYFAIGISGAIQHLVGMKGAGCVVAINKDASAPIFSVANYGLVGDLFEIVPAITAEVNAARG